MTVYVCMMTRVREMYHQLADRIDGHVGVFTRQTMHMLADYVDEDAEHFVTFQAHGRHMAFVCAGMRQYFIDPLGTELRDHKAVHAALADVYVDVDSCVSLRQPLVLHSNASVGYVTLYIVRAVFRLHPAALSAAFVQQIGLDARASSSNVIVARDFFLL